MINLNQSYIEISKLLKNRKIGGKISFYFSSKSVGEDFDPYENNYTYTNLNPLTGWGYIRELSGEQSFYKQYGVHSSGIKEIICENKYSNWFKKANKIEIDGNEYQVFKDSGGKVSIIKRPCNLIRVTLERK